MPHTPAPWTVFTCASNPEIQINSAPMTTVATVTTPALHLTDFTQAECEANAQLIAAAPELLEACGALVDWDTEHEGIYSQHNPAVGRLIAQAKAALAKAEGGN